MNIPQGFVVVCALLVSSQGGAATAEHTDLLRLKKEQSLLHKIERIEIDRGVFTTASIPTMLDLGILYVEDDRCPDAITILGRAIKISRAVDGLYNPHQLELADPMLECYLALDLQGDFALQQRYALLISDTTYGKEDPLIVPTLQHIAFWYEQAGWYISGRKLHLRSVDIVRKAGGATDLRMVELLRNIARAYRLEYVHGLEPVDLVENEFSPLRSKADLRGEFTRLDALGEESLRRATQILRSRPDADRTELIETLLDLGDWYQMGYERREALRVYQEAWLESVAPGYSGAPLFAEPVSILYNSREIGITLRRPPPDQEKLRPHLITFDFTVTREGDVTDVTVVESDAPASIQTRATAAFKQTRYRPRFADGQPVDTLHVQRQQKIYLAK